MKNRTMAFLAVALMLTAALGCRSLNQLTPAQWDDEAIEAEVRARIAKDVPEETFSVGISVEDGVVYIDGTAKNAEDVRLIGAAANDVEGVKRVVNRVRVE